MILGVTSIVCQTALVFNAVLFPPVRCIFGIFCGQNAFPDPAGGAYSAFPDPVVVGESLVSFPQIYL